MIGLRRRLIFHCHQRYQQELKNLKDENNITSMYRCQKQTIAKKIGGGMNCKDQPSAWWIVQPSGNMIYVSHNVVVETVQRMIGPQASETIHPFQVMAAWRSNNVKPLYEKQITAEKGR